MTSNKRLLAMLAVIALLVFGLGAFYLWLNGGRADSDEKKHKATEGLIPVKSIYMYQGDKKMDKPVGVGADNQGNFYVTLRDVPAIAAFDRNGNFIRSWGTRGLEPGQLMAPLGIAVDRLADHVYVVDRSRLRLICYDTRGKYLWEVPILGPLNVTMGSNGTVLVSTFGPIVQFSSEGEVIKQVGSRGALHGQFDFPRQTVLDKDGSVYVADSNNARIEKIAFSGELTATVKSAGNRPWVLGRPPMKQDDATTRFGVPSGIALDPAGRVVTLDGFRHQIEMLDGRTMSTVTDFGGERRGEAKGLFNMPTNITRLYGDFYAVTDTYNDRVQIIRLLAPGEVNPLTLYPWLKWLLLLLLLPLLSLFKRKRAYITRETLDRAVYEGNARLALAVFKRVYALPEVVDEYSDVVENGVRLGEFLMPVSFPEDVEAPEDAEDRLVIASEPTRLQKILLARHLVLCADDDQCERFYEAGSSVVSYEQLLEDYSIEGAEGAESAA